MVIARPVKLAWRSPGFSAPSSSYAERRRLAIKNATSHGRRISFSSAFHQDRRAGRQFWRFDRHCQPQPKRDETILNAVDLFRIAIRRQNDLLIAFQQSVKECGKTSSQDRSLLAKELNIVDQQCVNGAVVAFKLFDGALFCRAFTMSCTKRSGITPTFALGFARHNAVTHRVQQVSFTQTGAAIRITGYKRRELSAT